jgi:hypothetical protein
MKRWSLGLGFGLVLAAASARAETNAPVVHVDASSNVVLEKVEADGSATPVCHAPCDRAVAADEYRLTGDGVRTSNTFRIPEREAPVKIDVKARSSGGFTTGVVLTTLSAVFLGAGLGMLGGVYALGNSWSNLGAVWALGMGSVASLGASIGVGIPGITMLVTNAQSNARLVEGKAFSIPIVSGRF